MKNMPKKIYLQIGSDDLDPLSDFNKCSEVTWCEDRQHESDIEYVLAKEIVADVLNWLNQNPLEWEYGGDVDELIKNYFKSKR